MNTQKRSMKQDEKAVSPVIGVIMMIAIVVVIAAVVAAFAYGIIGGVRKAPSTALVVEGVKADNDVNVTIFHHGGDTLMNAFNATKTSNISEKWDNMEVRLNGAKVDDDTANYLKLNDVANDDDDWGSSFAPGDQLVINFEELADGDSIVILHVPSENILQRITVSG